MAFVGLGIFNGISTWIEGIVAPRGFSSADAGLAVTRRETNGWKWPIFMTVYLFALAYVAAGLTYWTAAALGLA